MFGLSSQPKVPKRSRWGAEALGWVLWMVGLGSLGSGHALILPAVIWAAAVIITAVRKPSPTRLGRSITMLAAPYYPLARLGRLAWVAYNRHADKQAPLKDVPLDSLSEGQLVNQLENIFQRQDFKVSEPPHAGNFGADLLLKRDGEETVVQVNPSAQTVGTESVQQLIGAMAYYDAPHGLIVSNSHFTPAAHQLAHRAGILLWDRERLSREMGRTGGAPLDGFRRIFRP